MNRCLNTLKYGHMCPSGKVGVHTYVLPAMHTTITVCLIKKTKNIFQCNNH